jgi:hypothetical protein
MTTVQDAGSLPLLPADADPDTGRTESLPLRPECVLICGVVGIRIDDPSAGNTYDQGSVLVWGGGNITAREIVPPLWDGQSASLSESWWKSDEKGWYTAVHPWQRPRGRGQGTLAEEMSHVHAVERLLDDCCDEIAPSTKATNLTCLRDGSCERRWLIETSEGKVTVSAKATIKPVTFLNRRVMEITVEVVRVE